MDQLLLAQQQVNNLLDSINKFIEEESENAIYKSPIIDWNHPLTYNQSSIIGIKKFKLSIENEKDYIESLINSEIPPRSNENISSNIPNLLGIWEQVKFSKWPIISISQILDYNDFNNIHRKGTSSGRSKRKQRNGTPQKNQIKIDLIENSGQTWVKVNTMKESRLMAEFREQDSYINSDYESDSSVSFSKAGPSKPRTITLTNSAIEQAKLLAKAAESYPRIKGFPSPKIRYVLNRLEENPVNGYSDPRVKSTFQAIRDLGVELVLADHKRIIPNNRPKRKELKPSKNILLDLSVLVALCCDSTHLELPKSVSDLESRFRCLQINSINEELELSPHIPVTKDLRDQLEWEMKHPLIQELLDRLSPLNENIIQFWVTDEVKNRLPNIIDIIGGENEKRRAHIMFSSSNSSNSDDDDDEDFWQGSRWKGKSGILTNLKINILPKEYDGSTCQINSKNVNTAFKKGFVSVVKQMLEIVEIQSDPSALRKHKEEQANKLNDVNDEGKKEKFKDTKRRSKLLKSNPNITKGINIESKLPSSHTLKTFLVGLELGYTILTNNRGSVGKILREMNIDNGLGLGLGLNSNPGNSCNPSVYGDGTNHDENEIKEDDKVEIWVVNPSSLSEWRRKEVEMKNKKLKEYLSNPNNEQSYKDWLIDNADSDEHTYGQNTITVNQEGTGRTYNKPKA
ncbi:uncharacterized protein L201_007227 [Kwoniella dendrophila CBS 6074]|uniref:DUF1308 domain-containing protein n=1 Tax=Kwoniella dendrophila CBS 6074 TaxID=1295534 RepID=A0AAX4K547_9TREE